MCREHFCVLPGSAPSSPRTTNHGGFHVAERATHTCRFRSASAARRTGDVARLGGPERRRRAAGVHGYRERRLHQRSGAAFHRGPRADARKRPGCRGAGAGEVLDAGADAHGRARRAALSRGAPGRSDERDHGSGPIRPAREGRAHRPRRRQPGRGRTDGLRPEPARRTHLARTFGKVFFSTVDGGHGQCSATVVNSSRKDTSGPPAIACTAARRRPAEREPGTGTGVRPGVQERRAALRDLGGRPADDPRQVGPTMRTSPRIWARWSCGPPTAVRS